MPRIPGGGTWKIFAGGVPLSFEKTDLAQGNECKNNDLAQGDKSENIP